MNTNKNQLETLQIISLQHELAMAIGNQIELREMLQFFAKVCIQRIGLISTHVYIYQDKDGWPETRKNQETSAQAPAHYLSIPDQTNNPHWTVEKLLSQFDRACSEAEPSFVKIENEYFHSFAIPGHGAIVLQSRDQLEASIIGALKPIFRRLANSCQASISHERLLREMDAREKAERTLHHQSLHSSVTGLPNKTLLIKTIEQDKQKANIEDQQKSLLCIEVENFRKITSILGQTQGDKIQKRFSQILLNLTRECDVVSQLDTSVFLILISQESGKDKSLHDITKMLVERIQSSIVEPLMIGSSPVLLSIRSGYEIYPMVSCDSDQVIKHAEIAKSESIEQKTKQTVPYSKEMQERVDNRIRMESALKKAGKNGELFLWWQPQYDAKGRLIGAEALLRWISAEWGFVSPGVFIPLAEESDLIEKIGEWVLETSCQQLVDICARGLPNDFKKLSINVSARQLMHPAFVEKLIRLTQENKIPRGLLAIELTESTLVQNLEQTVSLIKRLKEAGVECSIDDFGTGYSSLSYLKEIPIQTIKIDQSFVRDIHLSEGDQAIAKTLLFLGKNLRKDIIAEGVETKEERDCLIKMGCDQFQGYLYDKPVPLDKLIDRWYEADDSLAKAG